MKGEGFNPSPFFYPTESNAYGHLRKLIFAEIVFQIASRQGEVSGVPLSTEENNFWNNLTNVNTSGPVSTTLTATDRSIVLSGLTIVDTFEAINSAGATNSTTFPSSATSDSFWTGSFDSHEAALPQIAVIRLTNLPLNLQYRVSAFASRTGDDNGLGRLTRFSINDTFIDIEASDNTDTLAVFDSVSPNDQGMIELQVSVSPEGNGRFSYLNLLTIEASQMIEPTFGGYPVIDGAINTDHWLGWLDIQKTPWTFSYTLKQWLFLEEDQLLNSNGGWTYIWAVN